MPIRIVRSRRCDEQGGFMLVVVLMVISVLTALSVGLLLAGQWEGIQGTKDVGYLQALNLAEAGLERALWELRMDSTWTDGWADESLGNGTYSVTVADAPDVGAGWMRISSTGSAEGIRKTVTMTVLITS